MLVSAFSLTNASISCSFSGVDCRVSNEVQEAPDDELNAEEAADEEVEDDSPTIINALGSVKTAG